MKALTIKEPWATLIIDGYKKYEFRSWKTNYRGKILIHAGMSEEKDMLKKFKVKGVIHCFSGSLETAKTYIKMGYYLGIGGVVTFKNSKLGTTLQSLSLDNIVLETDSPYLAPVPYRGSLNSSKNIPVIAEYIANLYDVSVQEVAEKTTENVKKIYGI